ncbi:glutamate/gamma-aminobutyrate family transporter YjeM [Clostridium sp.]|uniref:glutamate/gamma-aminobutyrate family transporter YjeM n=1 Tax=Clostridium sp. TaxID=1506 RepID=UPI002FC9F732
MSSNSKSTQKLTLVSLILMIFTSVYGFNNMPRSFFLMGYAAIPWYMLSAITFFIPFAFMMAEYGAAFKNEKGGIFSWMEKSVGPRYAFMATFMWYASNIIWMVNVSSGIWVPFSNAIFGVDKSKTWSLFGLSTPQTLGILAVLWILFVTFTSSRGLDKIRKITSVGGTAVAALNIVLIVGAILVFIGNGGDFQQPVSFTTSPNPKYVGSLVATFSFLVFAIFAYGGIEVVGGLVDQAENPERDFPKGIAIAAIVIAIGYSVGIFCIGIFTNWQAVLSGDKAHMGNVGYVVMNNLGFQLGTAFGASNAVAIQMGNWVARFVGLSMLLALTGAFFALSYAPLKQLIEGAPKELWPGKMGELKDGMPINAMWIQATIVIVMILLVSFGGDAVSKFFDILVAMTNVAMTIPYMFLSIAFISFKRRTDIHKPFEVFKSQSFSLVAAIIVTFTVGFANFFSIIDPAMNGDVKTTLYSIAGPVFFAIVAVVMYNNYEKKIKGQKKNNVA